MWRKLRNKDKHHTDPQRQSGSNPHRGLGFLKTPTTEKILKTKTKGRSHCEKGDLRDIGGKCCM
jgi:hypothetical protein